MDHFTGHDHDHSHGHDHAHSHDHAHDHGESEYYIEQLLSIFISGAFGVTGILMYKFNMLQFILAELFRVPVLVGSILLIGLTLFRGFCLWKAVGSDHDDEHAHHDHSHDHSGHNHTEGEECCDTEAHEPHEHGNIYWRIVVLAFPILIFCMGLPNGTFSDKWIRDRLGKENALGAFASAADKGGSESSYSFSDLNQAAFSPEKREALAGTRASVRGQIRRIPGSQREFSLFYLKKTCCAADIVPLKARIVADSEPIADAVGSAFKDNQWVEVHGVIQFVEIGKNNFVVVLVIRNAGEVNGTTPIYD